MQEKDRAAAILGIGTAVPEGIVEQENAAERLAESLQERGHTDAARWAKRIFRQCGVHTRYTCEPGLAQSSGQSRYMPGTPADQAPTTAERMDTYRGASVPLAVQAARQALDEAQTAAADITHLITVSCTGMFLPGLDAVLVSQLGLTPAVCRLPLLFLGCAAGMTAVRTAMQLTLECPDAKILIVCVELCTLHVQPSTAKEDLFAASFFGDGASACVVGRADERHRHIFVLKRAEAVLLPDSSEDMSWEIGNYGFRLYLSPAIPERIGRYVPDEVAAFWGREKPPGLWAVHPGGRAIVDTLQRLFQLTDAQVEPSRTVLRSFGNLSSATILFVLAEQRRKLQAVNAAPEDGIALAFGPGLQAELLHYAYVPKLVKDERAAGRIYV